MNFYTYCYLDKNLKPYYVGKGTNDRINNPHHGCLIKLPPLERRIFLKKNLTEEEAFKHEIYMIAILGRRDLRTGILLNLTDGGEGTSGWVMPETVKEKIGLANSGRDRLDMRGENNPMRKPEIALKVADSKKGKPRDKETKQKISETLTGRSLSAETKQKQSKSLKGRKKSQDHINNLTNARLGTMYFVNCENQVIVRKENPGPGWQRGMKWKLDGN